MIFKLLSFTVSGNINSTKRGFSVLLEQNGYKALLFSRDRDRLEGFLAKPEDFEVTVKGRVWYNEKGEPRRGITLSLD